MRKYLRLQVTKPCDENFDNMLPAASGHFCQSCNKTVVDFTNMTDNQLMEYFRKPRPNSCGRFYADQLDKHLEIPSQKISWLRYFFTIGIPAMLLSFKADAQRIIKKNPTVKVMDTQSKGKSLFIPAKTLNGSITGEDGNPVPYASVIVKETQRGVAADSNGVFTMQLMSHEKNIIITAVGYEKVELNVDSIAAGIKMKATAAEAVELSTITCRSQLRSVALGGISVGYSVYRIWDKKPDSIRKNPVTMDVFPNPVKRNGLLTIQFHKATANKQQVVIYNAAGIKIQQDFFSAKLPLSRINLNLRLNAAGPYIIEVIDGKTNEKQALQLIVE